MSQVDLLCVSSADWDAPLWTNKQHLMLRLADRGVRVLYVDSLGLRRPILSATDTRRIVKRLLRWRPHAVQVAPNLLRDSPLVVPLHGSPRIDALNKHLLRARIRRNLVAHRLRRPILWTYVPQALDLYDPERFGALVYHCVDRLGSYPGIDSDAFDRAERDLVSAADVVIASSRPLVKHLKSRGASDVVYWPNPADVESFSSVAINADDTGQPVAGFIGALDPNKIDEHLLAGVAERLPHWRFDLVGEGALRTRLPANVHIRGHASRDNLPRVVTRFTAGIIPYAITPYTHGVFPMKVFEYLATGIPVVSTPLPSLLGEVEHVVFAAKIDEFANALEEQTAHRVQTRAGERREYARRYDWGVRTDEALALLNRSAATASERLDRGSTN